MARLAAKTEPAKKSPPSGNRALSITIVILLIAVIVPIVCLGIDNYFVTGFSPAPPANVKLGSMTVISYQIFQSNPDYVLVNLKNNGEKNLTISWAYIDNIEATIQSSPIALATNQSQMFNISVSPSQNLTDGATHSLKIVATDATSDTIYITYQPTNDG